MDEKRGCPPASLLDELIQGKVIEPDLSELSSHLEECSACQAKANTLSPSDTLIESLRGEAPVEDSIARDVPRPLIEKLKQIPRRDSGVARDSDGRSYDTGVSSDEQLGFLAPAQEVDEIGRLGHYRVLRVLGKGGMGAVFLAEDPKLNRQVALKVMLPRIAANPMAKDRFLREARAAARLKNDHIVTIYQVDEANGVPYLAMELLEGQSLDDVLRAEKPLNPAQIVHIARDIAKGLAAAHEKGMVHRDIKPGNLWLEGTLDRAARVKILDFGLARVERDDINLTQSGAIIGTPAYMAPEQARGDRLVDARADLFSFGCVLYQLCTGDIPFKAETTMGTLMAVVLNDPVALATRNDLIPPKLSQLIMQLLEKDPSRRPQTASDVILRLAEIEDSLPSSDVASMTPPRIDTEFGVDAMPHSRLASSWPPRNGGPRLLAVVGLSFAALVVAGAIFFWQTPDGRVVRIESDDPSIKVAFEDGELRVTGAYKEPITLKPGKVDLRIVKQGANGDDFEFETDKLIVSKGDKIVLRIEVVEGQVRIVQAGKGVLDSKMLTPPDNGDFWVESVARMEARDQVTAIGIRLKKLNPNFDATSLSHRIENGVVVSLEIGDASALKDLTPLRALAGLKELYLDGKFVGATNIGPLRGMKLVSFMSNGCPHQDLSPLKGMPLKKATFWGCATTDLSPLRGMKLVETNVGHSSIKDISVLKGMPLEFVCLNISHVEDLSPLAGAPLKRLFAAKIKATDLSPVANAPIEWLCIDGTPIKDLTPLLSMPLQFLEIDNPRQHAELLRKIPTLKTINHKPVAEVLGDAIESTDPDRRAAEWVLSIGGSVQANGVESDIKAVAELPKDRFSLTEVKLHRNVGVTDAGLAHLKELEGLTSLKIDNTAASDAGMAHLKDLRRLTWLDISHTKVTDDGLAFVKNFQALETLFLDTTSVTDDGLVHIKDLKELTSLALGVTKVTDEGLIHIEGLEKMRELSLFGTAVSDVGLARLKGFKRLKNLDLSYTGVTDTGLEHLRALTELTTLHLRAPNVTDEGLTHLKVLKRLTLLGINGTKVTAQGLADFSAAVPGCKVDHDDAIRAVDADRQVAEWVLSIGGVVYVNGGDREIKAATDLPKERFTLALVHLVGTNMTDDSLARLKDLKELRGLLLDRTLTDNGLAHLEDFNSLRELHMDGAVRVTDAGMAHIKDLTGLKHLWLGGTSVTDAGLAQLKSLKELVYLGLPEMAITDAGLAHVKELEKLVYLWLNNTPVTDAGLAQLQRLTDLIGLDLRGTMVTSAGVAAFHAAVPGCRIEHDGGVIDAKK